MRKIILLLLTIIMSIGLVACDSEARTVNHNISKSADSFEVHRRVVFVNGITDKYLLSVEGLCSLDVNSDRKMTVTCKVGHEQYKRHYLGLSDNVTYFVEQTDAVHADPFHYRVIFRPEAIIPDIDIQTSK